MILVYGWASGADIEKPAGQRKEEEEEEWTGIFWDMERGGREGGPLCSSTALSTEGGGSVATHRRRRQGTDLLPSSLLS